MEDSDFPAEEDEYPYYFWYQYHDGLELKWAWVLCGPEVLNNCDELTSGPCEKWLFSTGTLIYENLTGYWKLTIGCGYDDEECEDKAIVFVTQGNFKEE